MPCQPLVPLRGLQRLWRGLTGNLDQGLYMKMREMFKRRSTLSLVHSNLLASLHFTNVCEQAMEMEMASLHSHTWLQTLFIAVFAFHPTVVYHQVWITFLAVVVQIAFIIHMEVRGSGILASHAGCLNVCRNIGCLHWHVSHTSIMAVYVFAATNFAQ